MMIGEELNRMADVISIGEGSSGEGKPLLSTGSTLLNLACSGEVGGGFLPGKFHLLVGDASAGKTFLAMNCLAEACRDSRFNEYRLIYDNIEDGCLLDLKKLFSEDLATRLEPPAWEGDIPRYSGTVEEFYFNLDDASKKGSRPFIYVLDSMDALTSVEEDTGFEKRKKAARANQEVSGSYGMGKAKRNSEGMRRAINALKSTGSILIVLCQTRADLGPGYATKTRAGGMALRFYAAIEIWASIKGTIKKNIRGKDRSIGVQVLWKVKKNRATGMLYEVMFDIYPSYGIDDLGSCVDYLITEGCWQVSGRKVNAVELGLVMSREKLITKIEEMSLQEQVASLVGKCWNEIESDSKLKSPYRPIQ